jgi:peptide/nickel transport system substrate-binding protein
MLPRVSTRGASCPCFQGVSSATLGLLLLLCGLAGCGQRTDASSEGIADDTFVVLVDRDVEQLDPRFVSDPNGLRVSRLIFASLVTIDPQTLEPIMDLAEGIELETPTRYVVTLRPGLLFADGSALDADDVVATYESVVDPVLQARHGHAYTRITGMLKRDARTVVFELNAPHATFLTDLELPIIRAEDRARRVGDVDGEPAVGAGPYQVVERVPGRLTLRGNPHWYQGRVARERVRFVTVRDDNTRALRSGRARRRWRRGSSRPSCCRCWRIKRATRCVVRPASAPRTWAFTRGMWPSAMCVCGARWPTPRTVRP